MTQLPSRRRFLENLAIGAAGAAGADRLCAAHEAFAAALTRDLPQDPVDLGDLRTAYSLADGVTYLNHASIGTIPRAVQTARVRYLEACESNPWLHMWGGAWDAARERTRTLAATMLGCTADEVAITHNTTEGFNALAAGLPLGKGDEVLFSSLNHAGASHCWRHHGERLGYRVRQFELPLGDVPTMSEDDVVAAHLREIREETTVLALPHIDNIVGLRHPIAAIAERARAAGVRFIAVDGAQAVGMLPVDVAASGVDFYATSPHKWLQAPKGLGLLFVRKAHLGTLRPLCVTWGQERWAGTARVLEDYGTRNLPEVLALGDAIEFQQRLGPARVERRLRTLVEHLRARVEAEPRLQWRSPSRWQGGASLAAVHVVGGDSKKVAAALWPGRGIVVRPFSGDGLDHLRVSPGTFNTTADLDAFVAAARA